MGKKLLILFGVIAATAGLYYGLEMIKTSSTVDVENTISTNQIVEQIKQEINSYTNWNIESYKKIKSNIELKATMDNINLQEKTTLNTLLENKNAELLKAAFKQSIIACRLPAEINREINRLSEVPKYNEYFLQEKKTKQKYYYIKNHLVESIDNLCSNKYNEGSYKNKFKLIAKYFTTDIKRCNKMNALKTELKNKLETFQSVGISFENLDIENNEEWETGSFLDGKKIHYNPEFNRESRFNIYKNYKYYKDKLKSLNIRLQDESFLYQ